MPILQALVETDRPSRFLVQFCKHAAAMGGAGGHSARMHLQGIMSRRQVQVAAEWSETSGTVTFTPWGRATLTVDAGVLTVRIEGADEDSLAQIRDVITRDFARFSQRDPLTVTWTAVDDPGTAAPFPHITVGTPGSRGGRPRSRLQVVLLVLAVIVVVGVHIGLFGAAVSNWRWTGALVNLIAAMILIKIVLIVLARLGIRRRRAAKTLHPSEAETRR